MAEFVEVMKEMQRMCDYRQHGNSCVGCPISKKCLIVYAEISEMAMIDGNLEKIEEAVMKWSAEHPEPKKVYPTFAEWKKEMFPDTNKSPMHPCAFVIMECPDVRTCTQCAERMRIPEDVAKKLGIEPKEER